MDTYTITLKRKFWFSRKLKKVKANFFPDDMNSGYDQFSHIDQKTGKPFTIDMRRNSIKFMIIVFEDESRLIVNLDKYDGYELSKEMFYINAKKAEEESYNQVKLT